jgi:maleylacetoacetate isomerase
MMTLHGYWRSSASYRVRIALALKGIDVHHKAVNLKAGEQLGEAHAALNPQRLVPVLELEDGSRLTQSLAIIDYLEDAYPNPPLLPEDKMLRAKIRAAALVIASDVAPIQNLRVLKYIRAEHGQGDAGVKAWAQHWIGKGFESLEVLAGESENPFLFTNTPGYFECCLVPQIYNARRFGLDMSAYPKLSAIEESCSELLAFQLAAPENQPDADA